MLLWFQNQEQKDTGEGVKKPESDKTKRRKVDKRGNLGVRGGVRSGLKWNWASLHLQAVSEGTLVKVYYLSMYVCRLTDPLVFWKGSY